MQNNSVGDNMAARLNAESYFVVAVYQLVFMQIYSGGDSTNIAACLYAELFHW